MKDTFKKTFTTQVKFLARIVFAEQHHAVIDTKQVWANHLHHKSSE